MVMTWWWFMTLGLSHYCVSNSKTQVWWFTMVCFTIAFVLWTWGALWTSPGLFWFGSFTHRVLSLPLKADGTGIQQFGWIGRTRYSRLPCNQPHSPKIYSDHAFDIWHLLFVFLLPAYFIRFSVGREPGFRLGLQNVNIRISMVFYMVFSFWYGFDWHRFFEVFVLHLGIWLQAWRRLRVLPPRRRDEASERPAAQGTAWGAEGAHLGPAAANGCGEARTAGDLAASRPFFIAKICL